MARSVEDIITNIIEQWNLGASPEHIQGPIRQALVTALGDVNPSQSPELTVLILVGIGYVKRQAGDFEGAHEVFEEAHTQTKLLSLVDTSYVVARIFEEEGLVFRAQRTYEKAVRVLESSHDLYRDHARSRGGHERFFYDFEGLTVLGRLARVKGIIGNTLLERGQQEDTPRALELLEEELRYQQETNAPLFGVANAHHGLGKAYAKAADYKRAKRHFSKADDAYRKLQRRGERDGGLRGEVNVALDWADMQLPAREPFYVARMNPRNAVENISAFSEGDLKMSGADQMRRIAERIDGKNGWLYRRVEEALELYFRITASEKR